MATQRSFSWLGRLIDAVRRRTESGRGASLDMLMAQLPGTDCGQCGYPSCRELARAARDRPALLARCVHLSPAAASLISTETDDAANWIDMLGRPFDFVLEPFPDDPGPREIILPFNPAVAERLTLAKGDIVSGRPAAVGCPVTHVGQLMADPDPLSGTIEWCVVGPAVAREHKVVEVGDYTPIAYIGIVSRTRRELRIGERYHFLPRRCMLQSRHSAVISALARREEGLRVQLEGIAIA